MYYASLQPPPGQKRPLWPGTETLILSGCVLQEFKPYFSPALYYLSPLSGTSPVRNFIKGKVKYGITVPLY